MNLVHLGSLQTIEESFGFNGESSLDFQYAYALTQPQPLILLQTGDIPEGAQIFFLCKPYWN